VSRRRRVLAVLPALAAAGCANPTDFVVVTVAARDAVHDARSITVSLANAGTTRMDSLELGAHALPVTFSISAPGRTGELTIAVDAADEAGLIVGHGSATTKLSADTATVLLESTDFVVNTEYAGDQYLSSDFEASGFQLAALPDGTWTAAFRDGCAASSCSLFARRFDRRGRPIATQAAAGTNAFVVTSKPTTLGTTPAIASSPTATVALWDFFDPGTGGATGVACRAITGDGGLGTSQVAITTDPAESADVVSATAIAGGNFAVTWKTTLQPAGLDAIRMATITPDCTPVLAAQTVAQGAAIADIVRRGSIAAHADHVLFAWITNGELHTRLGAATGALAAPEVALIKPAATEEVEHARVVAVPGGGFAIAVRWTGKNVTTGPSRIDLFRVSAAGALVGGPTLVTTRSGNEFDSSESFGIAARSDPAAGDQVIVVWHSCGALGDDSMCGVFGRVLRRDPATDTFTAIPDASGGTDGFAIPTTTLGDQRRPSVIGLPDGFVVAWTDTSAKPPDTAGQSVRARIVYPPAP